MRPIRVSVTGTGVSTPVVLDVNKDPFAVGLGATATGTVSYTVEHTFDGVWDATFNPATATWFPHATLAAKTASADSNYAFPVTAVRLNIGSGTGTVVLTVIQAGIV